MTQWVDRVSNEIMDRVKTYRSQQGMSAQQLADRCTQLGTPMVRNVIANLESGRRKSLTAAELLVFAEALRLPPVALLVDVADFAGKSAVTQAESLSNYEAISYLSDGLAHEDEVDDALGQMLFERIQQASRLRLAERNAAEEWQWLIQIKQQAEVLRDEDFRKQYFSSSSELFMSRENNIARWLSEALGIRNSLSYKSVLKNSSNPPVDQEVFEVYSGLRLVGLLRAADQAKTEDLPWLEVAVSKLFHPSGLWRDGGFLDGDD